MRQCLEQIYRLLPLDVEKEDALQEQLGVPVITLKPGSQGVFDDAFKDTMKSL